MSRQERMGDNGKRHVRERFKGQKHVFCRTEVRWGAKEREGKDRARHETELGGESAERSRESLNCGAN